MLGTHFAAGWTEAMWNKLSCPRTDQSAEAGNWTGNLLINGPKTNQLSYFVPLIPGSISEIQIFKGSDTFEAIYTKDLYIFFKVLKRKLDQVISIK